MFSLVGNMISSLAFLLGRKDQSKLLHQSEPEKNKQGQQKKPVKPKKQGQKNNREAQDQPEAQPEKKKKKEDRQPEEKPGGKKVEKKNIDKVVINDTHISSVNTDQKQPAFPKTLSFWYPELHVEIITYSEDCLDTKYATGKVIKRGLLSGSIPIYVKYNKSREEVNIAPNLNFATLYLLTTATDYCISLAGSPLSHFIGFDAKVENVKDFTFDIIAQLYFLEKKFRIHNDVKPENIILYDGHWFLIDYEISHEFDLNEITYSKSFSKGYRSPERKKDFIISPKSDIYSLGLVILEILEDKRGYMDRELEDESTIFEKCDKFKDFPVYGILKKMLYSDANERSSPVELVKSLFMSELKLQETLDYFRKRERFHHLLNYETETVAQTLTYDRL